MQTKTVKLFGKTVAVVGKRPRVVQNRFGLSMGETFMGIHYFKMSRYLSLPMLAKRKFGGQADITEA